MPSQNSKKCKTCGKTKAREKFPKTGAHCKRCMRSKMLVKKYGITIEQYEDMLWIEQEGRCPICGKEQAKAKSTFHVDHNHKTGDIRAIICGYCNTYLMMYLHDNPKRAMGLANYLVKHFTDLYVETLKGK